MSDTLQKGLSLIGYNSTALASLTIKLEQYINELYLFNTSYDLCGADTKEDIIVKHILDSLSAGPQIKKITDQIKQSLSLLSEADREKALKDFVIADIGTGGGLPGIPLAIAMPDTNFVLVERMSKRCSFLENCVAILGLSNVKIVNEQAERVAQQSFDIAVFRAFRPLDKKMIKILLRIIKKPHGKLIAYKARSEKIKIELEGIKQWAPSYEVYPLSVPFLTDRERNLVIIPR